MNAPARLVPTPAAAARRAFRVSWAQLDANGHMANSAYLGLAADARLSYFADAGFPPEEYALLRIGPVIQRDTLEYFRECKLLETVTVDVALRSMSEDGRRFEIVNEIHRTDGVLAARVTSAGGWLHLDERRLVAPPDALRAAIARLPRVA